MISGYPTPAWVAAALLFAVPALLPFARSVEVPLLVGVVVGVLAAVRNRRALMASAAVRTLMQALAAYTLAALLSALDAVEPQRSWSNALWSLRYLAFGVGVATLCQQAINRGMLPARLAALLTWAAALPIAVWVIDALVQVATGFSLGGPLDADRLSGIFGSDDLKLGPILPTLAPLLLWPLLAARRGALAAVWLALLVVVLLAGSRAGWVSLALVSGWLAWRLAGGSWSSLLAWAAAAALASTLFAVVGYHNSDSFRARVDRTLSAGDGQVDTALAGRVPIWRTAVRMALAHPINGVGVRGFRYAYPDYAAVGDPWVDPLKHTGAAHAHQIVLELLTETGLIGLLLWLAAVVLLWRRSLESAADASAQAPWVALAVLVFPLNTHLAFYSSFMGIVLAWLLTLACLQALLREADASLIGGRS